MQLTRLMFTVAIAAAVAAVPVVLAEETYEPNSYQIDGILTGEEIWKVTTTAEQEIAGQITQRFWIEENWKLTPGAATTTGAAWKLAATLAGLGFEQKTPQGDQTRSYDETQLSTILDREGNKVPFQRTWTFVLGPDGSYQSGPEGAKETIEQLLEYAAYRLHQDGVLPTWIDRIPEEIRTAVREVVHEFAVEALSSVFENVNRELWNGLNTPFRTVTKELTIRPMEARLPPSIQPGAEFGMTGPDGVAAGRVRYLGTTNSGSVGHFEIVPAIGEAIEAGIEQTARFAMDRAGRPVSFSAQQNVTGAAMGPAVGGIRQTFRIEWRQVEKQG